MKTRARPLLALLIVLSVFSPAGSARGQSAGTPRPVNPGLACHPTPCVLPPIQASEGGSTVTDSPIVTNPLNPKELLLGSVDYNCGYESNVGFHLSTDGASTWARVECMPEFTVKGHEHLALDEPSVGHDRKGNAYIAGLYNDQKQAGHGFLAVQKSTDGTHWSKPRIALGRTSINAPYETNLTVDASAGSPYVNDVYASGIIGRVVVSHSTDEGTNWKQVAVDPTPKGQNQDDFTRLAVGKDGTVYATWMRCRGSRGQICNNDIAHMMFSKSIDGGNTWSTPQRIATVTMSWALPNTGERQYNYPATAVDNSDGPYAGNLYVVMYTWTGTYMRVQMIRSTDDGNTWSQPLPLASKTATHDQFFPSISVSRTGLVGASWLDRRNDPANIDYQVFAAISSDGGQSFQRNWQLTTAFSNPRTTGNGDNWMGDYTGNTWAGEDFIAAWMDSSNGADMQEVVGGVRLK